MPCMTARMFGFSIAFSSISCTRVGYRILVGQSLVCVSEVLQEEVHFVSAFLQKQRDSGR